MMNDFDVNDEIDSEIDSFLREIPLIAPPAKFHNHVMRRINRNKPAPVFHVTWMDLFVSLAGSISVSLFLSYWIFMPDPIRAEIIWYAEWIEYLGRVSINWIVPCIASFAVLVAGYSVTKSIRASG